MPAGTGTGTETYPIDTNSEWNTGSFTNTETDGSGNLVLAPIASPQPFDYSIAATDVSSSGGTGTASVEIRDTSSGTVLASDSVSSNGDGQVTKSGTFSIDVGQHPDLTFEATVDTTSFPGTVRNDASISHDGVTLVSVDLSGTADSTQTDTASKVYSYANSGTYRTESWDFTNTTTATKLSYSCSIPANDSLSFDILDSTGTTLTTVNASDGSDSVLFDVAADDVYQVRVNLSNAANEYESTPSVDSLTLEAHTPTTGQTLIDTRTTEVDLSWDELAVCDGYQVLYSTSTPVTPSDSVGFETNDSSVTSGTVTGLSQGRDYYFNVRAKYSGE